MTAFAEIIIRLDTLIQPPDLTVIFLLSMNSSSPEKSNTPFDSIMISVCGKAFDLESVIVESFLPSPTINDFSLNPELSPERQTIPMRHKLDG